MQKDPNKVKALEAAIAQIEKNYGQGSIMKLGDTRHMQVESVPTGSLSLDLALGDRKSTRLNSSHMPKSRMPSSA